MSDIAVIHMDLVAKGGGEAVCMNVLGALEPEHDVTLITLTDPDFDELNEYYNTDVRPSRVRTAGVLAPKIHERYGLKYYILQNALLGRYARRHADEFDLLFSTINELGLESDSVQYIHFPFDWTVSLENRDHIFHPKVEEDSLYERFCTRVAGVTRSDIRTNTLLANSEWTADVVADAYGVPPEVVYPPIDTAEFEGRSWADRENGFVTLGRIERSKRIKEMIHVVDRVRERGHDVHFHVVGPTVDGEYYREVEAMARQREYVELEGEVDRRDLVDLVCTHRFGIHGKEYEHFGMAVAELAAGGTIPFVPATGGQHVIVDDEDDLTYDSVDDAVEKIDAVLDDRRRQRDLRANPAKIRRRFGRDRFRDRIRTVVDRALDHSTEASTVDLPTPGSLTTGQADSTAEKTANAAADRPDGASGPGAND